MTIETIRKQLIALNGVVGAPGKHGDFTLFEKRNSVSLPAQIRNNYAVMNGAETYTDGHTSWMRFWPLQDWRPVGEKSSTDSLAYSCSRLSFVCADYAFECVYYFVDLDDQSATYGGVFAMGQTSASLVAENFDDFVKKVAENSDELHNYG